MRLPFVLLVAACTASVDTVGDDPAVCSSPAVFGKRETMLWPAVGMLIDEGTCTAALVAPDKILTAAHCLDDVVPEMSLFELDGELYRVVYVDRARDDGRHGDSDVAVGRLDRAVVGIPPMKIGFDTGDGPHTFVGYGCNDMCVGDGYRRSIGSGTKRYATFDGESFVRYGYESDEWFLCPGDSGGPVVRLDTMEIVAVASAVRAEGFGLETVFTHMFFANPAYALGFL